MSSHRNLNRGRYLRLMVLSSVEIFATIPLGTFVIVHNAKHGVSPWISWEHVHRDYSRVIQVPASVWKEEPFTSLGIEFFRWVLVASSLIFFAFFGFADEARQHYRLVYTSLASRVGIPTTTSTTLHGSSHAYVIFFSSSILPPLDSQVVLQHLAPSHEEQRRHHGSRRHHRRQAQLGRLDIRPAVHPVHLHRQRLQIGFQNYGVFAFGLYGFVLCASGY